MNSTWPLENVTYPLRFAPFVDCHLPGARNGAIVGTMLFTVLRNVAEIVSHRLNARFFYVLRKLGGVTDSAES